MPQQWYNFGCCAHSYILYEIGNVIQDFVCLHNRLTLTRLVCAVVIHELNTPVLEMLVVILIKVHLPLTNKGDQRKYWLKAVLLDQ